LNYGIIIDRENYRESIKNAQEAIKIDDKNAKGFYRLALAEKMNGDFDKSKESFITAIKLDPSNAIIRDEY
jgi:Tfp pilus assembly protein PilF